MYKYLLVILVCFSVAGATPPDIITSDIILLGESSEKAVFLVKTGYNLGSHYLWESRWYYLCMNLSDFTFEYIFQGSMISASEDYGGVRYSPNSESLTIPGALQYWDVDNIQFYGSSSCFMTNLEEMNCNLMDNCLLVNSGENEIVIPEVRCFDPGYLAVWNTEFQEFFIQESDSPVREVFFSAEVQEFEPAAGVQIGDAFLYIGQLSSEDIPRGVILYIPDISLYQFGL